MKKQVAALITGIILTLTGAASHAEMDHSMHNMDHKKDEMGKAHGMNMSSGMEMHVMEIDGYKVTFEIWEIPAYQKMMTDMKMEPMKIADGANRHITLTIYKGNHKISDALVNMKVVSPAKKGETHKLSYNPDMMSQYVGHFDMSHKGKYQIMTLFKINGKKHKGGFWHEMKR